MKLHMLTTVDNPYDPFTEYDDWSAWDERNGYDTPQFLARLTYTSHELSDEDQSMAIESAIEEVVRENVNGMYRRVEAPEGYVA